MGGGTSIEGDARPPMNGGIDKRVSQAVLVADFVSDILAKDRKAKILVTGDFNEFSFVEPLKTFVEESKLREIDAVGIPATERYTYIYDMNCQQLDHMFINQALAAEAEMEHIPINSWVSYDDQASDHDPTIALFNLCPKKPPVN